MTYTLPADVKTLEWPADAAAAIAIQKALRARLRMENDFGELKIVAGVDVSHKDDQSRAVIVLMRMGEWQPMAIARAEMPVKFPYVPGLLSFREIPVILAVLEQLPHAPDLLMVDGQGIAHPRRLGIAAHLGVLLNIPAIGVAKSRLTGRYEEPANEKGAWTALRDREERIGTVLRSKVNCLPLFISPGHRMDQDTALEITLSALGKYRLPEPTRIADKLSKADPADDAVMMAGPAAGLNLPIARE